MVTSCSCAWRTSRVLRDRISKSKGCKARRCVLQKRLCTIQAREDVQHCNDMGSCIDPGYLHRVYKCTKKISYQPLDSVHSVKSSRCSTLEAQTSPNTSTRFSAESEENPPSNSNPTTSPFPALAHQTDTQLPQTHPPQMHTATLNPPLQHFQSHALHLQESRPRCLCPLHTLYYQW